MRPEITRQALRSGWLVCFKRMVAVCEGRDTSAMEAEWTTEGRLLASNCFQCHGTGGYGGFDRIRGGEADEVLEYLTQSGPSNIMAAHAQGYTRAQLQTIIQYLQQ